MKLKVIGAVLFAALLYSTSAQATSYVVVDLETQQTVIAKNEDTQVPIASITKMMTALVVLKSEQSMNELVRVQDKYTSSSLVKGRLSPGLYLPRETLLRLALVSSDNRAAYSLAASYPGGLNAFVRSMNKLAVELDMTSSEFVEPTGILSGNRSTATDIVKLSTEASRYAIFNHAAAATQDEFTVRVKNKLRRIFFMNTNSFSRTLSIEAAKTGFTSAAGRCLAMVINKDDKKYALIVLGAPNNQVRHNIVSFLIEQL